MRKTILLLILIFFMCAVPGMAQTAELITEILEKEIATYMDFSYLIASEAGLEITPFEAYSWCTQFNSFPSDDPANTPITVKRFSHFVMQNYGLKGGIMWTAFKSPRYAWKELKSAGFWDHKIDPDKKLTGKEMTQAIGRFFLFYPEARLRTVAMQDTAPANREALLFIGEEK
ncbi:hypothetical protein K7I13_14115 [Brucepastera parasyntrophica]|uniref:hypothetical protein n=1 Tax=Brucepastera parasyntrophica TaxID=2880008 RepID=UPI00210D3426|nr:hypothetical protein [Brucepastera parasyntrophica]ULQ59581.1 hypothetical protein K7I13_14115 [Brucepastera parasyntrophica]